MPESDPAQPSRPLRILMLLHYPLDPNAGAAGYTIRLAEALRRMGNRVEVVGGTELFARLGRRAAELLFPAVASARTLQSLSKQRFDVVDASTGDLWLCPRRALTRAGGITVTRSHGLEHTESEQYLAAAERGEVALSRRYSLYYGGVRLRQVSRSLRISDGAIFCNERDREFAVEKLGLEPSRSFFVRAGLADYFLDLPAPTPAKPSDLGIAVIGPYMWRKGATTAAQALSRILRDAPGASATWLGADPREVTTGIPPDVRGRVRIRPHFTNPDLPELLEGHQVVLVLSRHEGYPGVVLEAMACGLAVIASDIPGSRDILAGTEAGVLVPPGDAAVVAREVSALFNDLPRLDKMRRRGHQLAQTFGWRDIALENVGVYNRLLERKRRRHDLPST